MSTVGQTALGSAWHRLPPSPPTPDLSQPPSICVLFPLLCLSDPGSARIYQKDFTPLSLLLFKTDRALEFPFKAAADCQFASQTRPEGIRQSGLCKPVSSTYQDPGSVAGVSSSSAVVAGDCAMFTAQEKAWRGGATEPSQPEIMESISFLIMTFISALSLKVTLVLARTRSRLPAVDLKLSKSCAPSLSWQRGAKCP